MSSTTSIHLSRSKRKAEESAGGDEKRQRRSETFDVNPISINDCVHLYQKSSEIISAMNHMKRFTLDGGVDVKIARVEIFPGYNDDAEKRLLDNLMLALDWRMALGFVPFGFRRRQSLVKAEPESEDFDDDGMDIDDRATLQPTGEPEPLLAVEDLEFFVPELGYGSYTTHLDLRDYRRKVEYTLTEDERRERDTERYVFTQDSPITPLVANMGGEELRGAIVNSPVARLVPHAKMLTEYITADRAATQIASSPPFITQRRPPAKEGTRVSSREFNQDGRTGAGFPILSDTDIQQLSNTQKSEINRTIDADVDRLKQRELRIEDDREYVGVMTPHAYTRVSDREHAFLSKVAIETGVPTNVILPGLASGKSSSSGMAGAAAGKKDTQSSGSKQSSSANESKKTMTGGFTADPAFNKALELRDFLQDFFQAVMMLKNGLRVAHAFALDIGTRGHELSMKESLIKQLDESIEKARQAVINFDSVIDAESSQTAELRANDRQNALTVTDPQTVKDINKSALVPPSPDTNGSGGGSRKPPSAGGAMEVPKSGVHEPHTTIPVPREVEDLTRRRIEIINDMQAISEAIKLRESMASTKRPISLVYRQPFVNDTSQIPQIISMLGLPVERGNSIAQRRMGLLS